MLSISPAGQALLDKGAWIQRGFVLFDLPSGRYGFWDGLGTHRYSGVDFVAGGSLIEVEAIEGGTSLAASSLVLRLRSIADSALTPDVLATIEEQSYRFRPVTFWLGFFDPDTLERVSMEAIWRGVIDGLEHKEDADGSAYLEATLSSRAVDYVKAGTSIRTTEDQKRFSPGDRFFDFVGEIGHQDIPWGPGNAKIRRRRRKWNDD